MTFDGGIKRRSKTSRFIQPLMRCVITPAIVTAILISSTTATAGSYEPGVGAISVVGTVHVNGEVARSGQTLFAENSIQTSPHSETVIDFRNLARLRLGSESALTFDASDVRVSGAVSAGQMRWLIPRGVTLQLTTPDAGLQIAGNETAVFDLATTECEGTTISVVAGQLKVDAPSGERVVKAGDILTTASTPPALHAKKKAGIFIIGGMAAALVLFAVTGGDNPPPETSFPGGCIDLLSGQSNCR